ncbi:hypothetical protein CBR_g30597 [Chara braunii]|uniref:Acireductone dioxygenase n=1 Tax=Chara braunii TaxID=69332 RepID=A0A388LD37_CHABU|nr:hypothetical protein CBR_g30597 [Chara braunii]|eukprot:GBG80231.1 hypothetical protein CBR_g30597 [Chara braunii]
MVDSKRQACSGPLEAWYMDDLDTDQRLPHRLIPNRPASLKDLEVLNLLFYCQDIITVSPDKLPNYEEKIKSFYEEHLHTDEEIRYVLDGSGYFDVRGAQDEWIRIHVKKGHMIVLPKGIYHRFTLDESNYIKAMRLFIGVPVWTPYNRPQDENPAR